MCDPFEIRNRQKTQKPMESNVPLGGSEWPTKNSAIKNQPDVNAPKPGPKYSWYAAGSSSGNWKWCDQQMSMTFNDIRTRYDGRKYMQEKKVTPDKLDRAADLLYKQTDGKMGKKWEPKTEEVEKYNLFEDQWFPARNDSWFRGYGAEAIEASEFPATWKRISDNDSGDPYQKQDIDAGQLRPYPEKLYQGTVQDFYFVQACYAISMKFQLIRNIFPDEYNDPRLGIYVLRFYKHAVWQCVAVDDFLPYDKNGKPLCLRSEAFPAFPWASIVEKAYAKLHGSWTSIGGGGSVEEVMTDLTGGCSGRFHTTDVAGDRLWKYFQELKGCCVWGLGINDRECSKRLIPIAKHWASAIWDVYMHDGVPYIGVFSAAPELSLKHFPMCSLPNATGVFYGHRDGFMWLRMDDFCQLFDAVYECRLVNSDLSSLGEDPHGYIPSVYDHYTPAWADAQNPWWEKIWAYRGTIDAEDCPTFLIQVHEPNTELILDCGTTDARYEAVVNPGNGVRGQQAPLLLRFMQCSTQLQFRKDPTTGVCTIVGDDGGEVYMVHMSAWAHTRDTMCCVKVKAPGNFVAMVSMPGTYTCEKMLFRTYSTSKEVTVLYLDQHKSLLAVNPGMPLCAIPYSLTGFPRIDDYKDALPRGFDDDEGKGSHLHMPWEGYQMRLEKSLGMKNDDEIGALGVGQKTVGAFGGRNAETSEFSAEIGAKNCSVM